jgi:hypothetical protein
MRHGLIVAGTAAKDRNPEQEEDNPLLYPGKTRKHAGMPQDSIKKFEFAVFYFFESRSKTKHINRGSCNEVSYKRVYEDNFLSGNIPYRKD